MNPDISGLRELGFKEKYSFEEGIRELYERVKLTAGDEKLTWQPAETEHVVNDEWIDFRRMSYKFPDGQEIGPFYKLHPQ